MRDFQLAQINIARFVNHKDHPANADFMAALDAVNAEADTAPGFVWRLVGEGNDAISIDPVPDDPRLAVNMSVWDSIDALTAFVYRTPGHLTIMRRRREWFEHMEIYQTLWWIDEGHVPTVAEGLERLAMLKKSGPGPAAFTFTQAFCPDGQPWQQASA